MILRFPGARTPATDLLVIAEAGSLQGVLVRVDGRDATARALLRDGEEIYSCLVSRDLAHASGKHLLGRIVRLHGRGSWRRDQDAIWKLIDFQADSFDVLDNANLEAAAKKLQAAGGFGLPDATDTNGPIQ